MILTVFRPLVLLLCTSIVPTESLVCFDCKNLTDTTSCSTTKTCGQGESCFVERTTTNTTLFTLGCVSKKQCDLYADIGTAIIGRSLTDRQDQTCYECCSTDGCALHLCPYQPLDGKWSAWTTWTECSVTCENGTQTRTRKCSNPPPANDGKDCQGNGTELKQCVRELCPVHGGWTEWLSWESCSVTCGVGMQRRHRNCSNPVPSRFGDNCYGDSVDDKLCFPGRGCTDGLWSDWNEWSTCSAAFSCSGLKTRSRTCSNPYPSPYGKYCVGNPMQITSCVNSECERDYSDCVDIKNAPGNAKSGLYNVYLWKTKAKVQVYCDMETAGGGWTVFQTRFNGTVDFFRTFPEYEDGFGQVDGEFWLGLRTIQEMTVRHSELRIDLTASDGSTAYELFQNFSLSPGPAYTLHIDPGTGTAGDKQGLSYHNGRNFVTKDSDNTRRCAQLGRGGWWYGHCAFVNLNGHYAVPGTVSNFRRGEGYVTYRNFRQNQSLKATSMMLRRNN